MLFDGAEMSLAKTDRRIAARHLALGGRDDLADMVLAEYDLTRRLVLEVTGHERLLADRLVLSRAVALRDPYVDALSHLQLRALAELRALPAPRSRADGDPGSGRTGSRGPDRWDGPPGAGCRGTRARGTRGSRPAASNCTGCCCSRSAASPPACRTPADRPGVLDLAGHGLGGPGP